MNRFFHIGFLALMAFFISLKASSQDINFKGISAQIQFTNEIPSSINVEVIIKNVFGDTLYREEHVSVASFNNNNATLNIGEGDFLSGSIAELSLINWIDVDKIELVRTDLAFQYKFADIQYLAIPYAFHSLRVEKIPVLIELSDTDLSELNLNNALKFNGSEYYPSNDLLGDTSLFSYYSGYSEYADTVDLAFVVSSLVDTTLFSYFSDSTYYSISSSHSYYSDSSIFADSSAVALTALNNWSLFLNDNTSPFNYLGTNDAFRLDFKTNAQTRFIIGEFNAIGNYSLSPGFHYQANSGLLINAIASVSPSFSLDSAYLFFNQSKSSLGIANNGNVNPSELNGDYSFYFGENVSAKGTYGSVFGRNSTLDSSSAIIDPKTAFVLGNNSRAAQYCVAIGDSAIASFYRNVAIGKNVFAGLKPASIAIGTNVVSTGSTAWAVGYNVTASGNFSTAIGKNASTNGYLGSFVYGDNSTVDTVNNFANDQFLVRAAGGTILYSSTDLTAGVSLAPGSGSWSVISDRNRKENILQIDTSKIWEQVLGMSIYSWNYAGYSARHVGPMAQDFSKTFNVGESDLYISTIDIDGITLGGIKYLKNRFDEYPNAEEINSIENNLEIERSKTLELNQKIIELYEKLDR